MTIHETKSFKAVRTKVLDASAGLVETVFSVTQNLDRQGDIIEAGAFAKAAVKSPTPTVVFSHVWDDVNQVLGKTTSWKELLPGDPGLPTNIRSQGLGGVKAQVKFDLDTPSGQLAFTHVKNQNQKEWSFAFDVAKDGAEYRAHKADDGSQSQVRHIKSISEIFEVSLVLVGANQATATVAWKGNRRKKSSDAPDYLFLGVARGLIEAELEEARNDRPADSDPDSWLASLASQRGRRSIF